MIIINGNDEFASTADERGWGGDGSEGNPYVIDGYYIDASGGSYGVYIQNTNVHFELRNSYIGNFSDYGIYFYSLSNGSVIGVSAPNSPNYGVCIDSSNNVTLEDVSIPYSYYYGLYLYESRNVTVDGGNFSHSGYGLYMEYADHNIIQNSNFSYTGSIGIYFYEDETSSYNYFYNNDVRYAPNGAVDIEDAYSVNNTFRRNDFSHSGDTAVYIKYAKYTRLIENRILTDYLSVEIYDAPHTILYGNVMGKNGIWMEYVFSNHDITDNNTVDGKPVYYYKNVNMNNASVPSDAEEVLLANVSYLKIEGLDVHSDVNLQGSIIGLYYSRYIYIGNSTLNNAQYGIYIYATSHSRIYNNSIGNGTYGIYITGSGISNTVNDGMSFSNEIIWNNINNNTNYGVVIPDRTFAHDNKVYNSFYYNHGSTGTYDKNHVQAYCEPGGGTFDDGKYGNYWYDWANNNDTNDNNGDGIVDWPYVLDGGNSQDGYVKDHYPLKSREVPVPEMNILWLIVPMLALLLMRWRR